MAAVEDAFRQHALGKAPPPGILGFHTQDGSFHIKAALLTLDQPYFAAKTNANFPHNGARHGLPTIQGVVVLCEAVKGLPLAVMDSMAITALRTAAVMAVAASALPVRTRYGVDLWLRRPAPAQLRTTAGAQPQAHPRYDHDPDRMEAFAAAMTAEIAHP
jgi:ornithine cyclodeaminase/alanine dehydrogenase-like protein (mu-crystallin family)